MSISTDVAVSGNRPRAETERSEPAPGIHGGRPPRGAQTRRAKLTTAQLQRWPASSWSGRRRPRPTRDSGAGRQRASGGHLSHALTTLADTRRARESQQRALELSAPTSTMTRTLLHIDAAACAHHDGDGEQACRRTIAALTALPDGYRTGLVRSRAQDLYEAIPAQHHHERAVQELRDVLAA
ncbi:hypothetical protein [Streptomyces naphthomycinicus]|uniref:hypothetical protein n=1 Tax=Streptomyces naphthomycinicus TaxID=2872625 RepID=UPI001CEC42BA|nr:hypothetical protein [Streptomyces sp. TML10]